MTDKTDPRLDALTSALKVQWGKGWMNDDGQDPADVLSDLDAADRAAGVVRVDTNDEALVERIAHDKDVRRLVSEAESGAMGWLDRSSAVTRAVLAALREAAQ